MRRALVTIGCAAVAALGWASSPARADVFGPIELVSSGSLPGAGFAQQADFANDTVISENGRYLAFDGSFAGHTGVFRRDLQTDAVQTVAEGDARLPSISADGRFVSFTTTARLDPVDDTNEAPDVYVRDMDDPSDAPCESGENSAPCAFTLASAVDGSAVGLSYGAGAGNRFGAVASGRSALSANGLEVAFETTATSNLANPDRTGSEAVEVPETPADEIAVRYLDTDTTMLVSARSDRATGGPQLNPAGQPEPTPTSAEGEYGAVYPSGTGQTPEFPIGTAYAGASLSADGSTVTWMGQQVAEQAPVLAGADPADAPEYTEPLWRRIGEGEGAPTRRVTGGSDPSSPQCLASGETRLTEPSTLADPCQGPFETQPGQQREQPGVWSNGVAQDYLPRLSANGMVLGFLANAREIASGEEPAAAKFSDDLYIVNMSSGLTRVAAARRLTELAGGVGEARTAPIVDFGVSPDGSQVAFSTMRTVFPLGSPAYVSAPAAAVGASELYDVDLADDTLTRVTHGFAGEPSESPGESKFTDSPSFDEDGNLVAFSSTSDNLVYGDGNGRGDAFVVSRRQFETFPSASQISVAPANAALAPSWALGVTALSRRDGTVLLEVLVPGAGTLRAAAQSAVRVRVGQRASHKGRGRAGSAKRARTTVATRLVASAHITPSGSAVIAVALKLGRSYSSLAAARGGLSSSVSLAFSAAGHAELKQSIAVTFVRSERAKKPAHKKPPHSKQKARR